MAKANVNPEELKRFARELNNFSNEMEMMVSGMRSRLNQLQENWDDQEQRKFTAEFNASMKALSKFLGLTREYSPFLMKKAQHIEDYLGRN
ncbi:MAG: WXG100 family type VII secretion target [Planctomycetota bacterium]|jgi:WXG100 family type VII secretion target